MSDAIAKGDVNAINYFVAQKYVDAFAQLASSPQQKTVIVPADMAGTTGSIAAIGDLVPSISRGTPPPSPPATPRRQIPSVGS